MQLNTRLQQIPYSGIRRIGAEARKIEGCLSLTIGEPDFDTPFPLRRTISESLLAGDTHYPPNAGISSLRSAIADHINQRFHSRYTPEETVVTIGSTEAIASAWLAILNPGDEVIVPVPSFNLYESQISLFGGVPVPMDTTSDGFQITEESLQKHATERTRAIIFASPNNPTGTILNASSLAAIRRVALERDWFVLCDSVYDSIFYGKGIPTLTGDSALTDRYIYINAFSKSHAMTGVRLGYAAADSSIMKEIIKAHSYLVVSAPSFIQSGCTDIFSVSSREMKETYQNRRDIVAGALTRMGLPFILPDGAFYIFPDISEFGLSSDQFVFRLMHEGKLALIPSSCFGTEGHVRISYCYAQDQLIEGMNRLSSFIHGLRE